MKHILSLTDINKNTMKRLGEVYESMTDGIPEDKKPLVLITGRDRLSDADRTKMIKHLRTTRWGNRELSRLSGKADLAEEADVVAGATGSRGGLDHDSRLNIAVVRPTMATPVVPQAALSLAKLSNPKLHMVSRGAATAPVLLGLGAAIASLIGKKKLGKTLALVGAGATPLFFAPAITDWAAQIKARKPLDQVERMKLKDRITRGMVGSSTRSALSAAALKMLADKNKT